MVVFTQYRATVAASNDKGCVCLASRATFKAVPIGRCFSQFDRNSGCFKKGDSGNIRMQPEGDQRKPVVEKPITCSLRDSRHILHKAAWGNSNPTGIGVITFPAAKEKPQPGRIPKGLGG